MKIGVQELIIVLIVVIVIFGPTQIPKLSKMFGKSVKSFKDGMSEEEEPIPTEIVDASPTPTDEPETTPEPTATPEPSPVPLAGLALAESEITIRAAETRAYASANSASSRSFSLSENRISSTGPRLLSCLCQRRVL